MIDDLNQRYIRARLPNLSPEEAESLAGKLLSERGRQEGIGHEDLLELPDKRFFRRKGEPAFAMVGVRGEAFGDAEEYVRHLAAHLPEPYPHSRDMKQFVDSLRQVHSGAITVEQAMRKMPTLKRVGGMCPCSKAVRWVMEEPAGEESSPMVRRQ